MPPWQLVGAVDPARVTLGGRLERAGTNGRQPDLIGDDDIANSLGREILGGLFSPGATLLGEEEICARFGASRRAAREAVKILSAKGLLLTRPRRGSRIRPLKGWNFLDPSVLGWLRASATPRHFIIELLPRSRQALAFRRRPAALACAKS